MPIAFRYISYTRLGSDNIIANLRVESMDIEII